MKSCRLAFGTTREKNSQNGKRIWPTFTKLFPSISVLKYHGRRQNFQSQKIILWFSCFTQISKEICRSKHWQKGRQKHSKQQHGYSITLIATEDCWTLSTKSAWRSRGSEIGWSTRLLQPTFSVPSRGLKKRGQLPEWQTFWAIINIIKIRRLALMHNLKD